VAHRAASRGLGEGNLAGGRVVISQPRVSVVTPVYNGEPYLAESIESVLSQTYENFDYTIVNNRSTDRTAEIAERYAARDARIKVLHNDDFLPLYANINRALEQISPESKYCKVVYADDAIFPPCLEEMVAVAELDPEIGIVSAYEAMEIGIHCQGLPRDVQIVDGAEAFRVYLRTRKALTGSMNTLLLRSDIVRQRRPFFRLDNNDYFEDMQVIFDILRTAKLGFVHQILTFTRRNNESTISQLEALDPWPLMRVMLLAQFGPQLFDAAEFQRWWQPIHGEYLQFLGESLLRRKPARYWDYHCRGMELAGHPLRTSALLWQAAGASLDLLLNPKSTFERLWARLRRPVKAEQPAIA
jgi:glycosyltransferase involved in cell wall biosynthesis